MAKIIFLVMAVWLLSVKADTMLDKEIFTASAKKHLNNTMLATPDTFAKCTWKLCANVDFNNFLTTNNDYITNWICNSGTAFDKSSAWLACYYTITYSTTDFYHKQCGYTWKEEVKQRHYIHNIKVLSNNAGVRFRYQDCV